MKSVYSVMEEEEGRTPDDPSLSVYQSGYIQLRAYRRQKVCHTSYCQYRLLNAMGTFSREQGHIYITATITTVFISQHRFSVSIIEDPEDVMLMNINIKFKGAPRFSFYSSSGISCLKPNLT